VVSRDDEAILESPVGLVVGSENVRQQEIPNGPILVQQSSGLEIVLGPITDTDGNLINYDSNTDLTLKVVQTQGGSVGDGKGDGHSDNEWKGGKSWLLVHDNRYVEATFAPEKPGKYKGQIYLWNFPILVNEVEFEVVSE